MGWHIIKRAMIHIEFAVPEHGTIVNSIFDGTKVNFVF